MDDDLKMPIEKFCGSFGETIELKTLHTWGSPCYVLDSRLQLGDDVPRFEPRSRPGIYLGYSPCHAGSVALVLNPKTLHVSPQFNVVFDDYFTTFPFLTDVDIPPKWEELVRASESTAIERYDLAKFWLAANVETDKESLPDSEGDGGSNTDASKNIPVAEDSDGQKNIEALLQPTLPDLNEMTRRKSKQTPKTTETVKGSHDATLKKVFGLATCAFMVCGLANRSVFAIGRLPDPPVTKINAKVNHLQNISKLYDGTINKCHHYLFNADASINDVYTLSQV